VVNIFVRWVCGIKGAGACFSNDIVSHGR